MAREGSAQGNEEQPDGRVQRGARNREAILEAVFQLIGEGNLLPTAEQVAASAGVGTRTVFRHFDDMEALHVELNERLEKQVRPLLDGEALPDAPAEERLRAHIDRLARLFERAAPYRRSGILSMHKSPFLQRRRSDFNRRLRAELENAIGSAGAELTDETWQALEAVLSPDAWERLRVEQRLGVERARAVMIRTALALLA